MKSDGYNAAITMRLIDVDKLIWSGITETYNPEVIKKLTNEIACTIHKKMIREGFIEK